MPHDLNETERAKLLARAQKLKDAQLDDFGDEARQQWNGRQANLFKYSGNDALLRRQLIDSGFAEVIQRGARSRPGIIKIWPNGDAPRYVPRERAQVRVRMVRETPAATTLNPKDVMKFTNYIEAARRRGASRRGGRSMPSSRRSPRRFGSSASIACLSTSSASTRSPEPRVGRAICARTSATTLVEFFAPEIDGDG